MIDLTCFGSNYIGIRGGCDTSAPSSGLYINDLPGISLRLAANLADEDTIRGTELLRNVESQAIRSVWVDVKNKLSEYIEIGKLISQKQYGKHYVEDTTTYLAPVAAEVGVRFRKYNCDPYTGIKINYVDIRVNSDVSGKVLKITDGCTVTEYPFDAVSCQIVRIQTNYTALTDEVFVAVDASDLALEDMSLLSGCQCHGSCRCNGGACVTAEGWNGTTTTSQAYGMAIMAQCVCEDSTFLCTLQDDLSMLVQMKMGILLAQELRLTKRYNFMVSNSKEDAGAMLLFWLGGIDRSSGVEMPSEYFNLLNDTVSGIKNALKKVNSDCITCGKVKAVETLP
jgi:hypothetical protein